MNLQTMSNAELVDRIKAKYPYEDIQELMKRFRVIFYTLQAVESGFDTANPRQVEMDFDNARH